jgi:hypothetical protein
MSRLVAAFTISALASTASVLLVISFMTIMIIFEKIARYVCYAIGL